MKKQDTGLFGCLFALFYIPIGIILELSKNPKYQAEPKRRRKK